MPFATQPRARVSATGLACRAIVATRLYAPDHELAVFRALQFAWFTTPLVLDDPDDLAEALWRIDGFDAAAVLERLGDPEVERAYQADRAEARTAEGSPTEAQGKAAQTDGPVRYTAPSLVFERDGRRLEAGGFQPVEAYDVLLANLDPTLRRTAPPEDPLPILRALPHGLVTQEVAAIMAPRNTEPEPEAAEAALIDLAARGCVIRQSLGDDALWQLGPHARDGSGPDRTAPGRFPAAHHTAPRRSTHR
jgi:hypothetical protein